MGAEEIRENSGEKRMKKKLLILTAAVVFCCALFAKADAAEAGAVIEIK